MLNTEIAFNHHYLCHKCGSAREELCSHVLRWQNPFSWVGLELSIMNIQCQQLRSAHLVHSSMAFTACCRCLSMVFREHLFSRTLPEHHRETSTAGSECHRGMGDKEWLQVCSPQVQSHTFHCTTVSGSETPHSGDWRHTSASGGVHEVPRAVVGLGPLI